MVDNAVIMLRSGHYFEPWSHLNMETKRGLDNWVADVGQTRGPRTGPKTA